MDNVTQITTLIFAALAGVGSVIRCYQNRRLWLWHQKRHCEKLDEKRKKNA